MSTVTVGRKRGAYDSELHGISNDFAIDVADMFNNHEANIKKVVVNDDRVGERDYFCQEDFGWDMSLSVDRDQLPDHLQRIIHGEGTVDIEVEIEAKMVKRLDEGDEFWPSNFKTADFGYGKYRDPKDFFSFKEEVKQAQESGSQILHFLCLYWKNGDKLETEKNGKKIAWAINFYDLNGIEKNPYVDGHVEAKYTTRGMQEYFYMVNTNSEKMLFLDLGTGEEISR
jgi:hypothetical protein